MAGELGRGGSRAAQSGGDAGAVELVGEGFGERVHERLAGVVGRHERARLEAGRRADVEDAPAVAGDHVGEEEAGQLHQRRHVHLDHASSSFQVRLGEGAGGAEAGVVHQEVDVTPGVAPPRGSAAGAPGSARSAGRTCAWTPCAAMQLARQLVESLAAARDEHDVVSIRANRRANSVPRPADAPVISATPMWPTLAGAVHHVHARLRLERSGEPCYLSRWRCGIMESSISRRDLLLGGAGTVMAVGVSGARRYARRARRARRTPAWTPSGADRGVAKRAWPPARSASPTVSRCSRTGTRRSRRARGAVSEMVPACRAIATLATFDAKRLVEFLGPCIGVCRDCETECRKHADKHEVC